MDKIIGTRGKNREGRRTRASFAGVFLVFCALSLVSFFGCATTPKKMVGPTVPAETMDEQLDAVQKVVGAMANTEVSRKDLKTLATSLRKDEEARSAVQQILGTEGGNAPVIKYSPVTGKHYSGDLEYEPGTGVKLEILPE